MTDHIITFLGAGHETTASTLGFALYLIASHPEVEKKVIEEIDRVFQGEKPLTKASLKSVPYVNMVVKETLRLYSVAPVITREAKHDTTIGGYLIPGFSDYFSIISFLIFFSAGIPVTLSVWPLHRNSEYWGADSNEFRPERWIDESSVKPHTYIPFGLGRQSPFYFILIICRAKSMCGKEIGGNGIEDSSCSFIPKVPIQAFFQV